MTDRGTMWNIMKMHVPRREWVSIADIFAIVESRTALDDEDRKLNSMRTPAWKLTVRRVLRKKKELGRIQTRKRSR